MVEKNDYDFLSSAWHFLSRINGIIVLEAPLMRQILSCPVFFHPCYSLGLLVPSPICEVDTSPFLTQLKTNSSDLLPSFNSVFHLQHSHLTVPYSFKACGTALPCAFVDLAIDPVSTLYVLWHHPLLVLRSVIDVTDGNSLVHWTPKSV